VERVTPYSWRALNADHRAGRRQVQPPGSSRAQKGPTRAGWLPWELTPSPPVLARKAAACRQAAKRSTFASLCESPYLPGNGSLSVPKGFQTRPRLFWTSDPQMPASSMAGNVSLKYAKAGTWPGSSRGWYPEEEPSVRSGRTDGRHRPAGRFRDARKGIPTDRSRDHAAETNPIPRGMPRRFPAPAGLFFGPALGRLAGAPSALLAPLTRQGPGFALLASPGP